MNDVGGFNWALTCCYRLHCGSLSIISMPDVWHASVSDIPLSDMPPCLTCLRVWHIFLSDILLSDIPYSVWHCLVSEMPLFAMPPCPACLHVWHALVSDIQTIMCLQLCVWRVWYTTVSDSPQMTSVCRCVSHSMASSSTLCAIFWTLCYDFFTNRNPTSVMSLVLLTNRKGSLVKLTSQS